MDPALTDTQAPLALKTRDAVRARRLEHGGNNR